MSHNTFGHLFRVTTWGESHGPALGATIVPESFSVQSDTNSAFRWFLTLNPTFGGTGVTWNAVANSAVEFAIAEGNNTISAEGTVIAEGLVPNSLDAVTAGIKTALLIGSAIDGTPDELWIGVQTTGGNDQFHGALNFTEQL